MFLFFEPCVDGGVVVAADAEGGCGELAALGQRGDGTLCVEDVQEGLVLLLAGDDNYVIEVLCTCADEADAAYVDLLDNVRFAGTLATVCSKG